METREQWLNKAVKALSPILSAAGAPAVPQVRIGVGFTSKGARSKRIGECWAPTCSADGTAEVFIHPRLCDPVQVLATLQHELIHAALGPDAKHGPAFKRVAVASGLTGRMTATGPTPELAERLGRLMKSPYPHGGLVAAGLSSTGPKQTTRMIKVQCGECGYTARTTRKWLEVGSPVCPVDMEPMSED